MCRDSKVLDLTLLDEVKRGENLNCAMAPTIHGTQTIAFIQAAASPASTRAACLLTGHGATLTMSPEQANRLGLGLLVAEGKTEMQFTAQFVEGKHRRDIPASVYNQDVWLINISDDLQQPVEFDDRWDGVTLMVDVLPGEVRERTSIAAEQRASEPETVGALALVQ